MPRVFDLTAKAYDANNNIVCETGQAFPTKVSKNVATKRLNEQVNATAKNNGVDVNSITNVIVEGMPEDVSFVPSAVTTDTTKTTNTTPVKRKPANKGKAGSKKDRAIALYKENKEKSRKEIIELFVSQLGMTTAGASTYYSMAKREA